jgi:hypothetical protein
MEQHPKEMVNKVDLHECLPRNVREFRFNQNEIADRFGNFHNFMMEERKRNGNAKVTIEANKDIVDLLEKNRTVYEVKQNNIKP